MDQLLGFVVLTGPLFLIVLWVLVCIALAVWIARKKITKGWSVKVAAGVGLFLLFFVLPFADEIAGRIYLQHLCETEGGAKIYHPIELPAEYWDANGNPKFLEGNGDVRWEMLKGVANKSSVDEKYPSLFSISDYRVVVKNSANEVSGEAIIYMFWGGWLIRATSSSNSAITCGGWRTNEFWDEFYNKLFRPTEEIRKEVNNGNN